MGRIFVDTGAWYALADSKDPDHGKTKAWFQGNSLPLVTTDYVFDETVTLIRMELGHRWAVEFFDRLLGSKMTQIVFLNTADWKAAQQTFRKYQDQKFSFTDCTSFAVMRRLGLGRVFAVDRHFRAMGFEMVP